MFKVPKYASRTNWVYETNPWQEVVQITLENENLDGHHIQIKGQNVVNFGNVSYLGLDTDSRLKKAAAEAIYRFGVQFSSSRSFVQLPLFEELEGLLEIMYGRPVVVTPSTTLGHLAAMPLFFNEKDAVLIDYQAHASLQLVLETCRAKGTLVELLPHGDLNFLEEKIKSLAGKVEKIWYVADGVYSMFGDCSDLKGLKTLYDKYENLYFYLDDAHGMSWTGKNGVGFVAENFGMQDRMLLLTSLNKAFAAGGGAIVCPNLEVKTWLKRCGSSLVFSGPVQPSALAAGIESAKIHLSPEIETRQKKVADNIQYFIEQARLNKILLADESPTPVFFVAAGGLQTGVRLCWHLREAGFYTNLGIFPAVPLNQTGLRVSIHHHLEKKDIYEMCRVLAELIPIELAQDNYSMEKLEKAFLRH